MEFVIVPKFSYYLAAKEILIKVHAIIPGLPLKNNFKSISNTLGLNSIPITKS